jgi:hypothetical protein
VSTTTLSDHALSSGVWAKLAAPLPLDAIFWRQDGKPLARNGKIVARPALVYARRNAPTTKRRSEPAPAARPGEAPLIGEVPAR